MQQACGPPGAKVLCFYGMENQETEVGLQWLTVAALDTKGFWVQWLLTTAWASRILGSQSWEGVAEPPET